MSQQPPAASQSGPAPRQPGTGAGTLRGHYEMCRPEYEAMLRAVGIRPGWRVLDAGCGGGDFLPLLAELVGPAGHISALDLAPENVAAARDRLASWSLPCAVEVREGSVTALPFPDDAFDAVWCANTLMYLIDDEVGTALGEFRRVVRPGGLVANKEMEGGLMLLAPAPPFLFANFRAYHAAVSPISAGLVRARGLRAAQRWAGLAATWQRTTLIERWHPLRAVEREYLGSPLGAFARLAEGHVPEGDLAAWRRLRDPGAADYLLDDPDLYYCEAHVLAVGTVPGPEA